MNGVAAKPIVLTVDDEPAVLQSLKLTQARYYDMRLATNGDDALDVLHREPDTAVIVADMQMPHMDGATLLSRVRDEHPDVVRVLLTGQSDIESAARAVNEGRIFRFLSKPCEPERMTVVLADAVEMHRLITAERVLLHKTLLGAVKAVISVLGLNNPEAMGRAVRLRNRTRAAAQNATAGKSWDLEFAALFSQLSTASLDDETRVKLYAGKKLSATEQSAVLDGMQEIADILGEIPRLEPVTKTLKDLVELTRGHAIDHETAVGTTTDARLLHALIDLESFESAGRTSREALNELEKSHDAYGRDTLAVLSHVIASSPHVDVGGCTPSALQDGMVLAEDLRTTDGLLLLPRGFELTRSSREHIVTRFKDRLPERIKVHVSPGPAQKEAQSRR